MRVLLTREGEKEGSMDRRGTASANSKNASPGSGEVLGPARFSRVRSALGKATFFFAVLTFRVLSGPYVALIALLLFFSLLSTLLSFFHRAYCQSSPRLRVVHLHPLIIELTPRRARACARTRCVAHEIASRSANLSECRNAIAWTSWQFLWKSVSFFWRRAAQTRKSESRIRIPRLNRYSYEDHIFFSCVLNIGSWSVLVSV